MITRYYPTLLFTITLLGGFLASCQEDDISDQSQESLIQLANNDTLGQYLVDQDGFTLYFFTQDVSGNSVCNGDCTTEWGIVQNESARLGAGLQDADFGTISREDDAVQTTFKGWPLYRFQGDVQPGEINGDGQDGHWFVAKPDYSVMLAHQVIEGDTLSQYIVDPEGRTLYYHFPDEQDISNCSIGCIEERPVFFAGENLILPSGLGLDKFDIIVREDGARQSSYKKRAMYSYVQDGFRGSILSHVAADWTVARVSWARPGEGD
ncbi:MAG: hypothetical protein AAF632_16345 [Bacteroidota bacterium]